MGRSRTVGGIVAPGCIRYRMVVRVAKRVQDAITLYKENIRIPRDSIENFSPTTMYDENRGYVWKDDVGQRASSNMRGLEISLGVKFGGLKRSLLPSGTGEAGDQYEKDWQSEGSIPAAFKCKRHRQIIRAISLLPRMVVSVQKMEPRLQDTSPYSLLSSTR